MRSGTRDVVLGMTIGMSATALVVMAVYFFGLAGGPFAIAPATATPSATFQPPTLTASVSPSPTITETPSFTPIPTLLQLQNPSPTITPSATSTPDVVEGAVASGQVAFTGPLSNAQQIALYRASLGYIRSDASQSRQLAKQINGVGYGDPTNICGPLAIAILSDAGLMRKSIIPHDFWLLNPLAATDAQLLKKAFPLDAYLHAIVITPLNKVDWRATPLLPGDFLFIWHGSWGNFDHMLVVNRVDNTGRAYAVTNYGTPDGYLISEALLYDPNDSTVGLFHQWTKERDAILGSTGFGGYELWRLKSP